VLLNPVAISALTDEPSEQGVLGQALTEKVGDGERRLFL
jgi:hypothetical protein